MGFIEDERRQGATELTNLQVVVTNRGAINEYLLKHTDLPEIVIQTAKEIRQRLPDVPLELELEDGPEDEDVSTQTLVLYVQPLQAEPSVFTMIHGAE